MKRSVSQFGLICCLALTLGSIALPRIADAADTTHRGGSVSGVVRDVAGNARMGVLVELIGGDSSVVARTFTDRAGGYSFATLMPGRYALKAVGASFIPTLKQNLHIRANTVVNLTLNTLYDLMQWTPDVARSRTRAEDDWAWTLRSAANRPLLRLLDDGSPEADFDGSYETATGTERRRMRLAAEAGARQFGSTGESVRYAMLSGTTSGTTAGSASRRMAMTATVSPDALGVMDAMLGFRQEMGSGTTTNGTSADGIMGGHSSIQTLAAIMADPQVSTLGGAPEGLTVASLRSWEDLSFGPAVTISAGSQAMLARLGSGDSIASALPFGALTLRHGTTSLAYRVATARGAGDPGSPDNLDSLGGQPSQPGDAGGQMTPATWLPLVSVRDGQLAIEHGLHQEIGLTATAGQAQMVVVLYGDTVQNPLIEGGGQFSAAEAGGWMLVDPASGIVRAAGPAYSTTGVVAAVAGNLPGGNRVRLSYASGDALVLQASPVPAGLAAILAGAHARHAQMYSLALSGTVDRVGTHWRASYRWQPDQTVTQVAPFALDASEPYLNVYIRQPLRPGHQGPGSVEALLDLRNLLSEGYQSFETTDGSRVFFSQSQRSIAGGLAFNF